MGNEISDYHNQVNSKMSIPEWAQIDCPFCEKKIKHSGIRNIGVCLNARNLGDISVVFHCDECMLMDTVYFRREISDSVTELGSYLQGFYSPAEKPVVEEEMHQLKYNNLIEKMIGESQHVDD